MKKITTLFLASILATFVFANTPTSYIFVKKTTEKEQVTVYFNLEKEVSFETLQSQISNIEGVKKVAKSEFGYIQVTMEDESHNDEIRKVIINNGSDIDKKFITITSKSYYEFN